MAADNSRKAAITHVLARLLAVFEEQSNSQQLVGRTTELATLRKILAGDEPEFLALYGRRRVGKTFLIREFFRDAICFELTGIHNAPKSLHLTIVSTFGVKRNTFAADLVASEITMADLF